MKTQARHLENTRQCGNTHIRAKPEKEAIASKSRPEYLEFRNSLRWTMLCDALHRRLGGH